MMAFGGQLCENAAPNDVKQSERPLLCNPTDLAKATEHETSGRQAANTSEEALEIHQALGK